MRPLHHVLGSVALGFVASTALVAACSSSSNTPKDAKPGPPSGGSPDSGTPPVPFAANPPAVYVAKVKNLLVALPPTDDEVTAVTADPAALGGLIDGWMKLPQYDAKMLQFFELAFQQTQITINDLADQAYPRQASVNQATRTFLTRNVRESFARTVLALNAEGRPFTDTMTTDRLMMTPALMELYAFFDTWQVNDDGKVDDLFHDANPSLTITVEASAGPIPIEETLDPASPNYMHWYDPDVATPLGKNPAGCTEDPIVYPARADALHYVIQGSLVGRKAADGSQCLQYGGSAASPQLVQTDFDDWKMVTIRQPASGEATTPFYDLASFRSKNELVLRLPRVGFFSTPAFFANWQTNTSNQMRVTTNQALIVALGAQVDGTDQTTPESTPGLDTTHAADGACFQCHQTLDPTRSLFASTYSWNYHQQTEDAYAKQKGLFAFQGVTKPLSSVTELGQTLATHPLFAEAWVQKLCYYANSSACDAKDPEFRRIVTAFQGSSSWKALVKDVFSSPLTTNAERTATTERTGGVVSVARKSHLCAALDARFGFEDVCALEPSTKSAVSQSVPQIAAGLPSDGYGRGAVAPVLPNQPSLFYSAGMENICAAVAAKVVDPTAAQAVPGVKTWSGKDPDGAIADFLGVVTALTASDPRYPKMQTILKSHFDAAVATNASATNALRSTFVLACLSPSALSVGM